MKGERRRKNPRRILHTLWTKAVGTPNYSRDEWTELATIIETMVKNDATRSVYRGRSRRLESS